MKKILLVCFLCCSLIQLSAQEPPTRDSSLFGKWVFSELIYSSDTIPGISIDTSFYFMFFKDGKMLSHAHRSMTIAKWYSDRDTLYNSDDLTAFTYTIKSDSVLIIDAFFATVFLVKTPFNFKEERMKYILAEKGYYEGDAREAAVGNEEDVRVETKDEVIYYEEVSLSEDFYKGERGLKQLIYGSLKYPEVAKEKGITGMVIVQFDITVQGTVENAKCVNEFLGFGLEEEALRLIQLTSGKWFPAKEYAKPVRKEIRIPVIFELL